MRSTFFKLFLVPAVAAAAALVTPTANAEATLNVPFSFSAMGKAFPAGSYTVEEDLNENFVTLRLRDGSKAVCTVLGPGDTDRSDRHVLLRFSVSGDDHVLDRIQYGSKVTSHMNKSYRHSQERIIAGQ
jgi:hypothetical protein